jgi:ribosome-binding ATPase
MPLSCGIVGLPNVGKSTIFNALTRTAQALAANYPFATIQPNVGEVPVPDDRLRVLQGLVKAQRTVPATVRFVDIAGLVRGASTGQGLGNAFLGHIRESDAIVMVVRCFEDENVSHVETHPHPRRDVDIVALELALADLETMKRRLPKLEREARTDPKRGWAAEAAVRLVERLEAGEPARTFGPASAEWSLAAESFLLTAKPLLYVANVDEAQIAHPGRMVAEVRAIAGVDGSPLVVLNGKLEAELAGLTGEEAAEYRRALGLERSGLDELALAAYRRLDLMTFLTAGEKEVRAWTLRRGTKAPEAAGKIHGDLEHGFIRAEVVSYDDYVRYGNMDALRSAGLVRSEGREYVMQEGDVVNFRFNV